jgi:hypothetical protein
LTPEGYGPRSIVQPPLTEADRAVLAVQALQKQRRDDQRIHVSFDDLPRHAATTAGFPRTPDEITPSAAPNTADTPISAAPASHLNGRDYACQSGLWPTLLPASADRRVIGPTGTAAHEPTGLS